MVGASGASVSVGVVVKSYVLGSDSSLVFPASSVAFAVTDPLPSSSVMVASKLPWSSAVAVPKLLPFSSKISTVEPASAVPVTFRLPSSCLATSLMVGASGASVSVGVSTYAGLSIISVAGSPTSLPSSSLAVAVTSNCSFSVGKSSLLTVVLKLPFSSVLTVDSGLPSPSTSISTLVLGSALPVIVKPSSSFFVICSSTF